MVIEEPPPPEPAVIPPPPETQTPKEVTPQPRHVPHKGQTSATPETAPETDEDAAAPSLSLEPRESSTEQATQRHEIQGLQDDVQKRIAKLSTVELSGVDRKTLDDARTFFAQSTQALNEGDLQRALMLAHKASLLVSALEK